MAEGPLSKAPNPSLLPGRQLADSPLLFVLIQNWAKNWPLQLTSEFLRSEDASCPGELRPNRAGKQLVALISLKYSCLSLKSTDQERWSHLASPLPLLVLLSASVCLSSLFTAEASGNFLIFVLFKSFTWFPPHARLISYSPCLKALQHEAEFQPAETIYSICTSHGRRGLSAVSSIYLSLFLSTLHGRKTQNHSSVPWVMCSRPGHDLHNMRSACSPYGCVPIVSAG